MQKQSQLILTDPESIESAVTSGISKALASASISAYEKEPTTHLLTFPEARLFLRCSAPTLRKMIREGRIHATRVGSHWRFSAEDVQSFLTVRNNT